MPRHRAAAAANSAVWLLRRRTEHAPASVLLLLRRASTVRFVICTQYTLQLSCATTHSRETERVAAASCDGLFSCQPLPSTMPNNLPQAYTRIRSELARRANIWYPRAVHAFLLHLPFGRGGGSNTHMLVRGTQLCSSHYWRGWLPLFGQASRTMTWGRGEQSERDSPAIIRSAGHVPATVQA
jgi:hypothetical protein